MRHIDLNADVGECADESGWAIERDLLGVVTSAHVACGGHAGDEGTMRRTIDAAQAFGVRVGAHPSYPDRAGFGRRVMSMPDDQLARSLREQLAALVRVAGAAGTVVQSVKPHGALYAEVGRGERVYALLLGAVRECCAPGTALVLPAASAAVRVAWDAGLPVLEEGFCDRAYAADGTLAPRGSPDAVIADPGRAAAQALGLARDGAVATQDGSVLARHVDTLCIHGDSPGAAAIGRAVRDSLETAGIRVEAAPRRT